MKYYYTVLKTEDDNRFNLIFNNTNNFNRRNLAVTDIKYEEFGTQFQIEDKISTCLDKKLTPLITKTSIEYQLTDLDLFKIAPELGLEITFNTRYILTQNF
ncbi:MAG: hypothetical protein KJ674_01035 [Nanoarchaeota archaeon]|nr:hypothetical protein [Nanoarchaeota archaeon]